MKDVCACFIGSNETAKLLATKSGATDIEFSHYARDKDVLTIVRPISYPEKIKTLIQAISMAEYVIIELENIDKYFGETIILLNLMKKKGDFIVAQNKKHLIPQVQAFIKDTSLSDYNFRIISNNEDIKALKDYVIGRTPEYGTEPLIVIDDFFNVKGVGTVALGFTKGGTIKSKDTMTLQPGDKKIQINSIQVMDVDYKELSNTARVGLALKNCDIKDLDRGSIISKGLPETKEITGELVKAKYQKKELNGQVMINNGLLNVQCELRTGEASTTSKPGVTAKIMLPKPIPLISDTIIYDPNANPRILGMIRK